MVISLCPSSFGSMSSCVASRLPNKPALPPTFRIGGRGSRTSLSKRVLTECTWQSRLYHLFHPRTVCLCCRGANEYVETSLESKKSISKYVVLMKAKKEDDGPAVV